MDKGLLFDTCKTCKYSTTADNNLWLHQCVIGVTGHGDGQSQDEPNHLLSV